MRKSLLVFALVCLTTLFNPFNAEASHFRFGILTQKPGTTAGTVLFHMQVSFRRDYVTCPNYNVGQVFSPASCLGSSSFTFGDGNTGTLPNFTVTAIDAANDWIIADMIGDVSHTYSSTGSCATSCIAFFQSTARFVSLDNRNQLIFRFETIVQPFSGNTSPTSSINPIVTVIRGTASTPSTFQVPAFDFDGDPMTFRLASDFEAVDAGSTTTCTTATTTASTGCPPNLSIDSNTGVITWDTSNTTTFPAGSYWTVQVMIQDHDTVGNIKSKTPVDFIMQVENATSTPPPTFTAPTCNATISGFVGSPISISVSATGGQNDAVNLNAVGVPGGATFSATNGAPATGTFNWTPTTSGSASVTFTATDNSVPSLVTSCPVNISVASVTTSTAVSANPSSSVFGQNVTVTATVTGGSSTVTGGSVTFSEGSTVYASAVPLTNGQASFSTGALAVAGHTITGTYSGSANFLGSSGNTNVSVGAARTGTTVQSSANPSVYGQSVTFTAQVSPVAPGAGTPTGTVQFQDSGNNLGNPVSLNGGAATLTTLSLSGGNHNITAAYSGDGNFNPSNGSLSQQVNPVTTNLALSSSANPSTFNQQVTFTANVTALTSVTVNSGSVQFSVDGNPACTVMPVSQAGVAACTVSSLSVGAPHTVTAVFNEGINFASSNGSLQQTVNPADQTITFPSIPDHMVGDRAFQISATASSNLPVSFVLVSGDASLNGNTITPGASTGPVTIQAVQGGNGNYNPAPAVNQTFNVGPAATSLTLGSSSNPSPLGGAVTFTATVSGPASDVNSLIGHWPLYDPAGTLGAVDVSGAGNNGFCNGNVNIGSGQNRFAGCPIFGVNVPGAVNTTAASFNGSNNFLAVQNTIGGTFSASAWINTTSFGPGNVGDNAYSGNGIIWSDIGGAANDMIPMALVNNRLAFGTGEQNGGSYNTIWSSAPVNTGQWVHVVVTRDVNSGAKQLFINGVLNAAGTGSSGLLNANSIIGIGANALDNRYFNGLIEDVQFFNKVLTSSEVQTLFLGGLAGTVTFADTTTNTTLGSVAVGGGGVAALTVPAPGLTAGSHNITATYGGSPRYGGSSASLNQVVNKAGSSVTIVSSQNPTRFGQSVSFTATVHGSQGLPFPPTGTVTFTLDGGGSTQITLNANAQAVFTPAGILNLGGHTIAANYSGDNDYSNSGNQTNEQVIADTPVITATVTPNPSNWGDLVTFTVNISSLASYPSGSLGFTEDTGTGSLSGNNPVQIPAGSGNQVTVTFSTRALSVGTHTINITYVSTNPNLTGARTTANPTVNQPAAPPFSQAFPIPSGACVCTALVENPSDQGTQHWFVQAAGTSLTATVIAQSVNPTNPSTVTMTIFDPNGVQVGNTVTAGYPSGTAPGTEVPAVLTIPTTPNTIYRVVIATPNTSFLQAHYRLKFQGALEAGMPSPSINAIETSQNSNPYDGLRWVMNADANEQLTFSLFQSMFFQPPTTATVQVFDSNAPGAPVPLIDPVTQQVVNAVTLHTFGLSSPLSQVQIATAKAAATTYVVIITDIDGHFRISKLSGSDTGIYASWNNAQHGTLNINISAGNSGFTGTVQGTILVPLTGGNHGSGPLPLGTTTINADVGHFLLQFTAPAGYTVTPSSIEVDVLCDTPVDVNVQVKAITSTTGGTAPITYGSNGQVNVSVGSASGPAPGNVSITIDGSVTLTQALVNGSAVFTIVQPSAGNHTIVANYAAQGSFLASASGPIVLHVDQRQLAIQANPAFRDYGVPNPAFSGTISNALPGDNITATYSTTATQLSPIGTYPITPAPVPNPALANYNVNIIPSTLTVGMSNGLYITSYQCGALTMSGNAFTDSYDSSAGGYAASHSPADGDIYVNGSSTLSGGVIVNGVLFTPNAVLGSCSNNSGGVRLSGKALATGGYQTFTPFAFLAPGPFTAGTQDLNINNNQTLAPGSYGDIKLSGKAVLTLQAGTYVVNSITLSGGSQITVAGGGQVILDVVGANSKKPIDLSGGSVSVPSGIPANFLINYAGSSEVDLSGQSDSYGVLYAPNANVKMSGGGDWFGSIVAYTLDDSGGAAVHYDRSLGH